MISYTAHLYQFFQFQKKKPNRNAGNRNDAITNSSVYSDEFVIESNTKLSRTKHLTVVLHYAY